MPILNGGENRIFPINCNMNSKHGILQRLGGIIICKEIHIIANNETKNLNILKFNGNIGVIGQYAEIIEVTACTDMKLVYIDIWDGMNSKNLTKNSADFSGMIPGSFFSKIGSCEDEYILNIASENRVTDLPTKEIGHPFLITAKNGFNKHRFDNFIRFNFTTNTILDFKMNMFFNYVKINGSKLKFI